MSSESIKPWHCRQCEILGVILSISVQGILQVVGTIGAEISQVEACTCDDPDVKRNAQKMPKPLIDVGRVSEEEAPCY